MSPNLARFPHQDFSSRATRASLARFCMIMRTVSRHADELRTAPRWVAPCKSRPRKPSALNKDGGSCSGRFSESPRDAPMTDWRGTLQLRFASKISCHAPEVRIFFFTNPSTYGPVLAGLRTSTITEQVVEHLREEIRRGRWKTLVPGKDRLARELEVGPRVLQRALKTQEEQVRESTVRKGIPAEGKRRLSAQSHRPA